MKMVELQVGEAYAVVEHRFQTRARRGIFLGPVPQVGAYTRRAKHPLAGMAIERPPYGWVPFQVQPRRVLHTWSYEETLRLEADARRRQREEQEQEQMAQHGPDAIAILRAMFGEVNQNQVRQLATGCRLLDPPTLEELRALVRAASYGSLVLQEDKEER